MATSTPAKTDRKVRDIFSLALKERTVNGDKEKNVGDETTVLIVGSKSSGKSMIILHFLERSASESPKPTMALEYNYGRRGRTNDMGKDIVHLWELGGGTSLVKLIEAAATVNTVKTLSYVIVLDLSKPDDLWHTLTTLLNELKSRLERVFSDLISKDSPIPQQLRKKAWEKLGDAHPDKDVLDPVSVPVVIVGSKYDVFRDFEPEQRKVICKTMRFIAHLHGASIVFMSDKDDALRKRCRGMLNALAFGSNFSRSVALDYNKPLLVPAGADSITQIGAPKLLNDDVGRIAAREPLDLWKAAYEQYFPGSKNKGATQLPDDPCGDPQHSEKEVDAMRAQKDEELKQYQRQALRKQRSLQAKQETSGSSSSGSTPRPRKPPSKPPGSSSKTPRRSTKSSSKPPS
eukprot:m.67908 g.67908  ORF g.67908 m.67908 type:complete len:403 (+) comp23884_c1_seq1:279-1487(+)